MKKKKIYLYGCKSGKIIYMTWSSGSIRTINTHDDATTPDFIAGSNNIDNCWVEIVAKCDHP